MGHDAPVVTRYHLYLLVAVASATFFEGFDQTIIGLVTPYVAREFALDAEGVGLMHSAVGIGAILALGITMLADRVGRRRMLLITIVGYALGTGMTALTRGPVEFVLAQLVTRVFLFAEVALSIVVIAEEFPARRRGLAISVLLAAGVAGGVAAAFALGPAMGTPLQWRAMYVIGLIPVLLVIPLRRGIRETSRYVAMDGTRAGASASRSGMFAVWRPPHLRTTVLCILLFGLIGAIATTFATFYPYFLANERGFSPSQVSRTYGFAALMGLPAIPLAGWLLDRWGRRTIGIAAPILAAAGLACAFQASGSPAYIASVGMAAVFFGTFSLPLQVAYVPELFPTNVRSLAMSWVGNGAGRALVILVPAMTGALAVRVGSVGLAASIIAVCGLAAAWLVFAHMPETTGLPLEETAESAGRAGSRAHRE